MASNTSRFNKILNFIGLVDEQNDGYQDYEQGRPQGAQTYNPSSRRQPPSSARPVRSQGYDEPRGRNDGPRQDYSRDRYESRDYGSGRDRYDAGSSREYASGRYASGYDQGYRDQRAPRYESRQSRGSDFDRTLRDEFDQPAPPRREPPRAPRPDTRSEYYSQRAQQQREIAPPEPVPQQRDIAPRPAAMGQSQTVIYYLHSLEECRDVISDLLDNKTVLLNLEDMDERQIQRGIDTLCGAAFALDATVRKASDKTYLIAPNSVRVANNGDNARY